MKTSIKILPFLFGLLLTGCSSNEVQDITPFYAKAPTLQRGYHLGGVYVLQRDLIVTKGGGSPAGQFVKPGDGVPTVEEWRAGVRKAQVVTVVTLVPAGTRLQVEKIFFIRTRGGGVNQATGMLRAPGVDLLINPFAVSDFLSVSPYGTLCLPDEKFLREEKK